MTWISQPNTAFKLSLIAGILMIVQAVPVSNYYTVLGGNPADYYFFSVAGVTSGVIVLLSAIMLRLVPSRSKVLGAIILVFSIASALGGGGFLIGLLLGVFGGISTWKARIHTRQLSTT